MDTYTPDVEELLGPSSLPPQGAAEHPPSASPSAGGGTAVSGIEGITGHDFPRMFGGAYDGASRFDKSVALWAPALRSADYDMLPEKSITDARVRDSLRNDAYVAGGAALHKDNIVGSMYLLNSKPNIKVLGLDETWESEFQEEVEAKFTLWAESPDNWVDASRRNTLTGMVRLAVGVYVAAGEMLATVEWLRDGPRPFNTAIQMIDLDRLNTPYEKIGDIMVRGGVEHNKYGAPQNFFIRKAHPSDFLDPGHMEWKTVPIRKPWGRLQVLHFLEQTRPDQTRGIADMVAALKELRITKKFRDVTLQSAVVNATYAASIESELPTETVFQALGAGDFNKMQEQITGFASSYLGAIAEYAGKGRNFNIDGVKIPHLFPGTKLQMRPAGQGGPLGTDFESSLLRYIAAILGVSYEELSRDYTKTNYSSAKAAGNTTWKFMQSRKRMVADRFASSIFRLWLEEAINKGQITTITKSMPNWYDGLNADAYSTAEWIGASRGQIDELKETQAAVLRMKFGLATSEDELARLGKDWRSVYRQLAREQELRDKLGIDFMQPADNMMNAATGTPSDTGQGVTDA